MPVHLGRGAPAARKSFPSPNPRHYDHFRPLLPVYITKMSFKSASRDDEPRPKVMLRESLCAMAVMEKVIVI